MLLSDRKELGRFGPMEKRRRVGEQIAWTIECVWWPSEVWSVHDMDIRTTCEALASFQATRERGRSDADLPGAEIILISS